MPRIPKYFGLCENCEYDSTCTLRRSTQLKIIQCEEFSIQPLVAKIEPAQRERMVYEQPSGMGLCANCLHSLSCGFPDARQGVVQCEEYLLDEAGILPPAQPETSRSAA